MVNNIFTVFLEPLFVRKLFVYLKSHQDSVTVHKYAKTKELGQYPAISTLCLVNHLYKMSPPLSKTRVYLGARTCERFLCFIAIVRVRVSYVDFFVLRHW